MEREFFKQMDDFISAIDKLHYEAIQSKFYTDGMNFIDSQKLYKKFYRNNIEELDEKANK